MISASPLVNVRFLLTSLFRRSFSVECRQLLRHRSVCCRFVMAEQEPTSKVAKLSASGGDQCGEGKDTCTSSMEPQPLPLKQGHVQDEGQSTCSDSSSSGTANNSQNPVIRVMQWNTLADALSTSSPTSNFVRQCSANVLSWASRSSRLLEKIREADADIVCLEEVDHYHDFFEPRLQELGYAGTFQPKPDSPCCRMPINSGPDGCALFHKVEKLSLENERVLVLEADGKPSNRVAILKKLSVCSRADGNKMAAKQTCFCVGVTHLKAKPKFSEMRLAEGSHLLKEMEKFGGELPCIVCGDFNAEPDEPVCLHFRKSLASAYSLDSLPFTTWKFRPSVEVCHTIDYIWYSPGDWQVKSTSYLPTKELIGKNGLPSLQYPSDHLPLVCSLLLS